MGRKLDLSGLTDNEAEHVLHVVQRDMKLRKKEEERLSELKQELDEEGSRCLLLSRQSCFNQRCCIRCCLPFTFLLNPKRQCRDCRYNVCKACRVYNKREKTWLCSVCQKSRLLKTQSLEWFYTNVKKRFKRFGSAKVLKTLYRKHLAEHSALSELTEGSAYEESVCNEGSVSESDSTFYRQKHSMAETLSVAMRVAEEAIDEAISKAEFDTANQEKQNEAHYLREHRAELVEELAKTIVQKIISRRKTLAEMKTECDQDWPLEHADPHHHQSTCDQASRSLKHQGGLWRSHSAFSLLDNDPPGLIQDSLQALKKEGSASTISAWKSVDRLDNAVLKSPDGNWIALQSAQLSRPSLLTRRKSLVYSALERESGVVSAYEGMGSDNETKSEPDSSWGAVLQEIHRRMTDSNSNLQDTQDRIPLPVMDRRGSRESMFSDSEGNWKPNKHLPAFLKRNMPAELRRPSSSRRTSIIDVNFNVEGAGVEEESSLAAAPVGGKDLNKDHNQYQLTSDGVTSDTLTSGATTSESFDLDSDMTEPAVGQMNEELRLKLQQLKVPVCDSTHEEVLDKDLDSGDDGQREENSQGSEDRDEDDERLWEMEMDLDEVRTEDEKDEERDLEEDEEEMKHRLYKLVAQSRLTYFSSTDDELNKAGRSEGECDEDMGDGREQEEEKTEGLTYKLCRLEKEVRATQFSSTEDELDRVGIEESRTEEKGEDGKNEELAVKVCRLAKQINATQFSSTEDELDRAGRGKDVEEAIDDESLWKLQTEKTVQATQLRDLASLVSASQFSSTEDELDKFGKNEGDGEQEVNERGTESSVEMEDVWRGAVKRRESFGDLDAWMFVLRDETEETKTQSGDEKERAENVLGGHINLDDIQHSKTEKKERGFSEETITGKTEEETLVVERELCEDKAEKAKETQEGQEMKLESVVESKKTEDIIHPNETREEHENQPEAKWPDENRGQDKFTESKGGQRSWEAAADSEEEDTEFARIISSMLMMTLEDMQVETLKDEAAENRRINRDLEEVKTGESVRKERERGLKDDEAQSTNVSVENQDDNVTSGTAGRQRAGKMTSEQIGENSSREKESEERMGGNVKEQGGKDRDPDEKENIAFETNQAQMGKTIEVDDGEQEDGEGKKATERKMMEMRGDAGEECSCKEKEEKPEETKEKSADDSEQSSTSSPQEGLLSPEEIENGSDMELYKTIQFISSLLEQRYSAVSLRSITTEVLKVLNATEELLQEAEGEDNTHSPTFLPPNTDLNKLDQQFSRLEENVYVAAGSVYSLEAELSDLEECARGICSSTSDMELSFLEEQVASAAAKVQQSELQPVTLDSSRQLRRRLPAPPVKDHKNT
ncbi:hypothetical protein INR49_013227 [Caranx melampygus]|nr:hypothetical protein INR49_013227 [Caranx melampygus]